MSPTSVIRGDRMDTHKNALLTPKGREMMVRAVLDCGLPKAVAARRFNTTPKTVGKWVERFRAQGVDGLRDRSSRPLSSPSQTAPATCATIEALRRQRHTSKQIAVETGVSSGFLTATAATSPGNALVRPVGETLPGWSLHGPFELHHILEF